MNVKALRETVRKAVVARDEYTIQVLEAEYQEWNGPTSNSFTYVQVRKALRGAIDRLKAAYLVGIKEIE